jgi:hypothetical protein
MSKSTRRLNKTVDNYFNRGNVNAPFSMIASQLTLSVLAPSTPTILQFPADNNRAVKS